MNDAVLLLTTKRLTETGALQAGIPALYLQVPNSSKPGAEVRINVMHERKKTKICQLH